MIWAYCLTILAWLLLACAAWVDRQSGLLPDRLILPATLMAIGAGYFRGDVFNAVSGAVMGFAVFKAVQAVFLLKKREALGSGDVKLMLALGALAGSGDFKVFNVILISSFGALILNAIQDQEIRFGPYLVGFAFPTIYLL